MPGVPVVNVGAIIAAAKRDAAAKEIRRLREDLREYEERAKYRRIVEYWQGVSKNKFNEIYWAGVYDPLAKELIERGFYRSVNYRGLRFIGALMAIDNPEVDSPMYYIQSTNFKNGDAVWIMDRDVKVDCGTISEHFKGRNFDVGFTSSCDEMSNILKDMIGSKLEYFNELKRIFDLEEIDYSAILHTEDDPDFVYTINKEHPGLDDKLQFFIKYVEEDRIHCDVYVFKYIMDEETHMVKMEQNSTGWKFDVYRHDIYCGIFPKDYNKFGFRPNIETDTYDYWEEEKKRKEEMRVMKRRCAQPLSNDDTWSHALGVSLLITVGPILVGILLSILFNH